MILLSLRGLFSNDDYTMTQTSTLLENWEHKDIKFKELIDFEFPLPQYIIHSPDNLHHEIFFDADGLKAIDYNHGTATSWKIK
jgi:hypothetical protein